MQKELDLSKTILTDDVLVYFDIETSNLLGNTLLQISCSSQDREFDVYCEPTSFLNKHCQAITGLYNIGNKLFKNGRRLCTFPVKEALQKFKDFIESFDKNVVLVAHNCFGFDAKIISKHFNNYALTLPRNLTKFADPLPALKKLLKTEKIENFRLTTLCRFFDIELFEAHNSKFDTKALQMLCEKIMKCKDLSIDLFFTGYVKPVSHFENQRFN